MKKYLKDSHPELWAELDPNKNTVDLNSITTSNPKAVWWVCEQNHSWEKAPSERTRVRISKATNLPVQGAKCPICANKQVLTGFNDLATINPQLAEQWHPTKNGNLLTPKSITGGSSKKVWWQCTRGHEWEASPYNRNRTNSGCLICTNGKVEAGFNDLESKHPELAAQWHETLNSLPPSDYLYYSAKKAWWKCEKGHEWEAQIYTRVQGKNCPVCINKKIVEGVNDLRTTHPELVKEINNELNKNIDITMLHAGSGVRVYWDCLKKDHHPAWQTTVAKRAIEGQGCAKCSNQVSQPEEDLFTYLTNLLGVDAVILRNDRNVLNGRELDFYLPEYNFAIEYNGLYWHSEKRVGRTIHYDKWKKCEEQGIQLFTIWEDAWLKNEDLVKRMLAVKLHKDSRESFYGRNTVLKQVTSQVAKPFLETNHLQGYRTSSKFYGLFSQDDALLSVLSVRWNVGNHELEISRFASAYRVVGGFSKLLKAALADYPNTETVLSYSENSISDGGLYEKNGFVKVNGRVRSYSYIVGQERVHRSHFTKAKFQSEPYLVFKEGLTETELAELNNLDRVWDAGNTRWELAIK